MTGHVFEIAEIDVNPGDETAFEEGVRRAASTFKVALGCRSLMLQRSVETPTRYQLVVGWDTVDNHMIDFRESEGFQVWRSVVSNYFAAPPRVGHVQTVFDSF